MTDDALRDKDAEFERLEKEIDSLIAMTKHNAQILRKLDREIAASLRAAQTAPDSGVVVEAAEHTIGELQKSIRNIAYWIEHGKSETAAKEIRRIMDAGWMATGYGRFCDAKRVYAAPPVDRAAAEVEVKELYGEAQKLGKTA